MEIKFENGLLVNNTPLDFITHLLERNDLEVDELEFSKYVSGGQGITISRDVFRLPFKKSTIERIEEECSNLEANQELAIHSNVYRSGKKLCIPLIDFSFREFNEYSVELLNKIKISLNSAVYVYETGHSFHGYVCNIIEVNEWYKFLGMLLLLNPRSDPFENVDSRWIGHSLENEFSALRLTCNSSFYIKVPEFISLIK